MIILGIETSCDETALSIIETAEISADKTAVKILSNAVLSQIAIHVQYGGVFPMVAKREHGKNLIPLLKEVLKESQLPTTKSFDQSPEMIEKLRVTLERESELSKLFLEFIPTITIPKIDLIAVTTGPGLEPALWVGLNFARALSIAWNIPVVATNHMEGHILISLLKTQPETPKNFNLENPEFPALALLISGGHTEMVLMRDWLQYEIVGRTRDDAVGEAFDKVARILGLPYPGGPQISALAEKARSQNLTTNTFPLPRPMLKSGNLDFSFSGLKTAVLYLTQKLPQPLSDENKVNIAREFEDSATEVITEKVKTAIENFGVQTLILGGGVVANKNIRSAFQNLTAKENISLKLPAINHSTDNALMIAIAGYFNREKAVTETTGLLELKANGNLSFNLRVL